MFPLFYGFIAVHFKLFIHLLILILHRIIFVLIHPLAVGGAIQICLQAGVPCSLVTGRTSSLLPRRGYSPRCCRSRSPAPFLYGQVVQCAVSHARTARPATEALPQQGLVCGTVYHRIYATKKLSFRSFRRLLKTHWFTADHSAMRTFIYCAIEIRLLTYLID